MTDEEFYAAQKWREVLRKLPAEDAALVTSRIVEAEERGKVLARRVAIGMGLGFVLGALATCTVLA